MPIWMTLPVEDEPEIKLVRWRVFETELSERHFVGWSLLGREGRVSSPVVTYDPVTRKGVTKTGRVYKLCGASGYDGDGLYVWSVWSSARGVTRCRDVTDEIEDASTTEEDLFKVKGGYN